MSIEGRIDDLIEAGWKVLDSDFDPVAFHCWRRRAFDCLADLLGADHVYTLHFARFARHDRITDQLAAVGILSAVEQQMAPEGQEPARTIGHPNAVPAFAEKLGCSVQRSAP